MYYNAQFWKPPASDHHEFHDLLHIRQSRDHRKKAKERKSAEAGRKLTNEVDALGTSGRVFSDGTYPKLDKCLALVVPCW